MKKISKMNKFLIGLIAVVPIIFYFLLPYIGIGYNDEGVANKYTVLGTIISYIGFLYTFYQLFKLSSLAQAANKAKLDTIHSINFNNVIDFSNSIINSCYKVNELLKGEHYLEVGNQIRELTLKIIEINSCISIIKEKEEFSEILDFKKYLNDLKITLNDINNSSTISNFLKLNIQRQLDSILFEATQLKAIKIKIVSN